MSLRFKQRWWFALLLSAGWHLQEEEQVELGGVVRRSVAAIAECFACDLCRCLLDDPVTAPECMHM